MIWPWIRHNEQQNLFQNIPVSTHPSQQMCELEFSCLPCDPCGASSGTSPYFKLEIADDQSLPHLSTEVVSLHFEQASNDRIVPLKKYIQA